MLATSTADSAPKSTDYGDQETRNRRQLICEYWN